MRKIKMPVSLIVLLIVTSSFSTYAQDTNAIYKKLVARYALTQPTADSTDIVTPGAVVVLQKDKLTMVVVSGVPLYGMSTYKDGKISLNPAAIAHRWKDKINCPKWVPCPQVPQAPPPPLTRVFVKNEKMWVTGINVKADSVVLNLLTDAYGDNRFKASLTFPFAKGPAPSPDDVARLVQEVFTVQPDESASAQSARGPADGSQQPPPIQAGASDPPAVIAPPPPPPSDSPQASPGGQGADPPAVIPPPPPPPPDAPAPTPKTITLGQTPEDVVAILGQPEKTAKIGARQTYFYKDLKVIFVGGQVTDVQ